MLKQLTAWVKDAQRVTLGAINERFSGSGLRIMGNLRRGQAEQGDAYVFDADVLLKDLSAVEAFSEADPAQDGPAAAVGIEFVETGGVDDRAADLSERYPYGFELTAYVTAAAQGAFLTTLAEGIAAAGSGQVESIYETM